MAFITCRGKIMGTAISEFPGIPAALCLEKINNDSETEHLRLHHLHKI